jgi:hypothetical protein
MDLQKFWNLFVQKSYSLFTGLEYLKSLVNNPRWADCNVFSFFVFVFVVWFFFFKCVLVVHTLDLGLSSHPKDVRVTSHM